MAASRERNRIKTKWRNSSFQKEKWKRRERVQLEIELNVAAHSWSCSEGIQKLTCVFLEAPWPSTVSYETGAPSCALWLHNQLLRAMGSKRLRPAFQRQSIIFGLSGLGVSKFKQLPLASVGGSG